jgi:hypothetical protein
MRTLALDTYEPLADRLRYRVTDDGSLVAMRGIEGLGLLAQIDPAVISDLRTRAASDATGKSLDLTGHAVHIKTVKTAASEVEYRIVDATIGEIVRDGDTFALDALATYPAVASLLGALIAADASAAGLV